MQTPDLTFGPEWAVLELLCLGPSTPGQHEAFVELVQSGRLNWGELLDQALRHRMLPLLAYHVSSSALEEAIPSRIAEHLIRVLDLNKHRRVVWYREAASILEALGERGVPVVGRKAAAFEASLYGSNGSRWLGDIDFLILPGDRNSVESLMPTLDFQLGLFDWRSGRIIPFNREQLIKYRLNPDHLPTFTRVTRDPIVREIEVDFANSLTWAGSLYEIPIEDAFEDVSYEPVSGFQDLLMPCLAPHYQFLDTILHLFREAWFATWLEMEQDVDLMKFGDVVRLWHAHRHALQDGPFVRILEDTGVVDPVVWVLEHLDRALQTDILSALGLEARATESWLASAQDPTGHQRSWRGTMRERLYRKDRRHLLVGESQGTS